MSITRTKDDSILQCILQYCAPKTQKTALFPLCSFPPLLFPFYRLKPVCTAASLPPKPHVCSPACFSCHEKPKSWITTCPTPPLPQSPNEPAATISPRKAPTSFSFIGSFLHTPCLISAPKFPPTNPLVSTQIFSHVPTFLSSYQPRKLRPTSFSQAPPSRTKA